MNTLWEALKPQNTHGENSALALVWMQAIRQFSKLTTSTSTLQRNSRRFRQSETDEAEETPHLFLLIPFHVYSVIGLGSCGLGGLCAIHCGLVIVVTATVTQPKAGTIEEAFIETFQEPIGFFL